jgi:hypothetical protein
VGANSLPEDHIGNDALAVADRVFEEVENLGLEGESAPHRAAARVTPYPTKIFEGVEQRATPLIAG